LLPQILGWQGAERAPNGRHPRGGGDPGHSAAGCTSRTWSRTPSLPSGWTCVACSPP